MQIALHANAFGIARLQTDFESFIGKSNDVIDSFAVVTRKTRNANGGIGDMNSALSAVNTRISLENTRKAAVSQIRDQAECFAEMAITKDTAAAVLVNQNKDAFYRQYPHLKPPPPPDEKAWYEECWEWLCDGGEKLVQDIKDAWEIVKSWASDALDSIVSFYLEHKKIIDTILVVVAAVAAIVGVIVAGPLALTALLGVLGVSGAMAATISTAVFYTAIITTALSMIVDVSDIWLEIDNPFFNFLQGSLQFISGITTLFMDIGSLFNSFNGILSSELDTIAKYNFSPDDIRKIRQQDRQLVKMSKILKHLDPNSNEYRVITSNLGEMMQDKLARMNGLKGVSIFHDNMNADILAPMHKGIDGLYYSDEIGYVVAEAKFNTSQLRYCKVGGKQMSFDWIEDRMTSALGREMADMILNTDFISQLTNILPDGTVIISHLDDAACTITKGVPFNPLTFEPLTIPKITLNVAGFCYSIDSIKDGFIQLFLSNHS